MQLKLAFTHYGLNTADPSLSLRQYAPLSQPLGFLVASSGQNVDVTLGLTGFRELLRQRGEHKADAAHVSTAAAEMIDNAIEHAQGPYFVLTCVDHDSWGFVVGDLGRGVRASLSENPSYAGLHSEREALKQCILPGISCTGRNDRGTGFEHLLQGLQRRRITFSLSSGSCRGTWSVPEPGKHHVDWSYRPMKHGFVVEAFSFLP